MLLIIRQLIPCKDQYKYICNPRVLYAPNNTAADTIIVKVSISISVIHECYMLLIIWQLIPLL